MGENFGLKVGCTPRRVANQNSPKGLEGVFPEVPSFSVSNYVLVVIVDEFSTDAVFGM
jgi:hypothetical protein